MENAGRENKNLISIVIPVFNELECIRDLYDKVDGVSKKLDKNLEIIFVNDGSTDGTDRVLNELADADKRVRVVHFRRNFGQTAALSAGFNHSGGDVIITMDGDGQNDPSDIPALLEEYGKGFDIVSGWRKKRRDNWLLRRLPSFLGNKLISVLTGVRLHDFGCTLKVYNREIIDELDIYGEMHRMIPVLAHLLGASISEVEVNHHARSAGQSKYNLSRAFSVILDLITLKFFLGYFTRPLHFFGLIGLLSFFLGVVAFGVMTFMKIEQGVDMTGNPFMILGVLCVIVGMQLVMLGLLGEITIRTYFESQKKPTYVIKEIREKN